MANRSYLYATSLEPGSREGARGALHGVAECAYALPVLFRLLCGVDTRVAPSRIWEHETAISADFTGGVALAADFLQKLVDTDIRFRGKPAVTAVDMERFATFFAALEGSRYFHLECLELYDMSAESVEEFAQMATVDVEHIRRTAALARKFLSSGNLADSLRRELEELAHEGCGTGLLARYLYFDFSGDEGDRETAEAEDYAVSDSRSRKNPEKLRQEQMALWEKRGDILFGFLPAGFFLFLFLWPLWEGIRCIAEGRMPLIPRGLLLILAAGGGMAAVLWYFYQRIRRLKAIAEELRTIRSLLTEWE